MKIRKIEIIIKTENNKLWASYPKGLNCQSINQYGLCDDLISCTKSESATRPLNLLSRADPFTVLLIPYFTRYKGHFSISSLLSIEPTLHIHVFTFICLFLIFIFKFNPYFTKLELWIFYRIKNTYRTQHGTYM